MFGVEIFIPPSLRQHVKSSRLANHKKGRGGSSRDISVSTANICSPFLAFLVTSVSLLKNAEKVLALLTCFWQCIIYLGQLFSLCHPPVTSQIFSTVLWTLPTNVKIYKLIHDPSLLLQSDCPLLPQSLFPKPFCLFSFTASSLSLSQNTYEGLLLYLFSP